MDIKACARCHRPAPPDRAELDRWHIVEQLDGSLVWAGPECITTPEQQILDSDELKGFVVGD